jgi:hypothetical protein
MKTFLKTLGVTAALAATCLGFTQGAEARDRWERRGGGDDAAIAIGAGILGLAVGAVIADRGDSRYYDRSYYGARRYVTVRGRPGYYYYYDGAPRRYYQDRFYGRPNYYGGSYYGNGWGRGYGYGPRGYGRPYRDNRWNRGGYGRGGYSRDSYGRGWDRGRDYDRRDWNGRGDGRRDYRR